MTTFYLTPEVTTVAGEYWGNKTGDAYVYALSAAIQRDAKALLGLEIGSSGTAAVKIAYNTFKNDPASINSADGKTQTCTQTLNIVDRTTSSVLATARVEWTQTSLTK